ncbi:MAG: hypothetical protein KC502_15710 [Myxococcales bacterium]|nr:hypothetical protein [Myxococcales bacterium]
MTRRLQNPLLFALVPLLISFLVLDGCGTSSPGNAGFFSFNDGGLTVPSDGASGSPDGAAKDTANRPDTGAADSGPTSSGDGTSANNDTTLVDADTSEAQTDTSGAQGDTGGGATDTALVDSGSSTAPDVTSDVPWGSEPNTPAYDAGQYNYADVQSTGGNTGSGGAGLCIPKISQLNLKEIKAGGKVDIIWWIDTSGSMGQEAKYLNSNINAFATFIAASNIDYRVILIGKSIGSIKVCVAPPLGGPGCTKGPKFLPVQQYISSKNGLDRIISTYPLWKGFLRKDATKNFVAVTDDNSYKTSSWFIAQLQKLDAAQFKKTKEIPHGFVHHSIVGYPSKSQCKTLASVGTVYLDLTAKTKGVKFKICETNWAPIFQQIAKGVINTAKPACTHKIPLPVGMSNAKGVTVNYVAQDDFFNVPPAGNNSCPGNGVGYTVDNVNHPTKITLCTNSCNLLNGGGNIQFDFGCFL